MKHHLHILRHALGIGDDGHGREYRNYYAAEPNDIGCNALVCQGHMSIGKSIPGGLTYFHVTQEGRRRAFRDVERVALTRSQMRYRRFLDADSGMKFREWLMYECTRSAGNER